MKNKKEYPVIIVNKEILRISDEGTKFITFDKKQIKKIYNDFLQKGNNDDTIKIWITRKDRKDIPAGSLMSNKQLTIELNKEIGFKK